MTINYYHYCDSNEISTGTSVIVGELDKKDWSADQILSHIIADLGTTNKDLTRSIEYSLSGALAENLRKEDEIADNDFVCLKQFVKANTYLPNANLVQDAVDVWGLLKSHNLNLHKQSCEKQLALSKALLGNLDSAQFKAKIANLIAVSPRVEKFKQSTSDLETAYSKIMEANAVKENITAPSALKNEVRKIVNERLLPHLENAVKAMPEIYQEILGVITETIEAVNAKAQIRKSIRSKAAAEEIPAE
ncbi:DUF6261 family protein [Labilibaculum euxinus]